MLCKITDVTHFKDYTSCTAKDYNSDIICTIVIGCTNCNLKPDTDLLIIGGGHPDNTTLLWWASDKGDQRGVNLPFISYSERTPI